jgi:hypothetical protein
VAAGKVVRLEKSRIAKVTKSASPDGRTVLKDVRYRGKVYPESRVVAESGEYYWVVSTEEAQAGERVRVPFSEIDSAVVRGKHVDPLRTLGGVGLAVAVLAGVAAVVVGISLASWDSGGSSGEYGSSCPFIYSYDGQRYVFDAEPFGGAICRGLARTEWCRLEHAAVVDGRYRLRMTNELDETQFTDETTLIVVDHPRGSVVAPDLSGRMHTFADPQPPQRATDREGRDARDLFAASDDRPWETLPSAVLASTDAESKEELTLEFAKPRNARQAKLLVNARTTLWGSRMVRHYLSLQGRRLPLFYRAVNRGGHRAESLLAWAARDELFQLEVRVETAQGWATRAIAAGGNPFAPEERAYALDVSDAPGDTLRLRLTPAATFWAIDRVAVEYGEDAPVVVREVPAMSAADTQGRDVRSALRRTDRRYLRIDEGGLAADLEFAAPPLDPALDRTVFVKAGGYYEVHVQAEGPPQKKVLARFDEPGFPIRLAIEEYRQAAQRLAQVQARQ